MLKKIILIFSIVLLPAISNASTQVLEGEEALEFYKANKGKYLTLAQLDKTFILRETDGKETMKPDSFTIKAGTPFFITNEEEKYVHNVYDNSDNSWVLKKQHPSEVAVLTFNKPGEHRLRCAIHPKMKVKVIVE